jgi:dimethylhistidine N-methyltransferase
MYAPVLENEFAREVRSGLTRAGQKTLPCRYLYDAVGSALFEAITCLPEYGLSRADARILQRHAGEIVAAMPAGLTVVELGSGSGAKTRPILEKLAARECVRYHPIDLSPTALAACVRELAPLGAVRPIVASYLEGLHRAADERAAGETLLVLFLGSTIGNFETDAAVDFLAAVRLCLRPGDGLLLGTDLVKPVPRLLDAYDDPAGVTAAFNLNLLARINRELSGNFNLRRFEHVARYDAAAQRVEMHLRAQSHQSVTIRQAELSVEFAAGETIWTEACHKFYPEQVRSMGRATGFRLHSQWTDREWPFAETLLLAV